MIARDVINRALRIVGVTAAGETADSADTKDALDVFNGLLAEWDVAEVGLPDTSVASLGTTMETDMADRDAMAYQLAFRIGPDYGFEPTQAQMVAAEEAFARLRLRYFEQGDSDYSELPSQRYSYNIDTD